VKEKLKAFLKSVFGREATDAEVATAEAEYQRLNQVEAPPNQIATIPGVVQNPAEINDLKAQLASLTELVKAEKEAREADKKSADEKEKANLSNKVAEQIKLAKAQGYIAAEDTDAEASIKALLESNFDATVKMMNLKAPGATGEGQPGTDTGKPYSSPDFNQGSNISALRTAAEGAFKTGNTKI